MLNVEDRVPLHPGRVELIPVGGDKYDMRRADEPVQEGTPLNRRTMQLLQADRRTYPVAEGETITAGDVVDVRADGTVGKTIVPVTNETVATFGNLVKRSVITKLSGKYSVHLEFYTQQTFPTYNVRINLLDNMTLKIVGGGAVASSPSASPDNLFVARLSDTTFVCGYAMSGILSAKIGTVSERSVSLGAQYQLSAATTDYNAMIPLSEDSFLAVYNRAGLKAKVYSVSGTAITFASEASLPGNTSSAGISATLLPDAAGGNKRVCVCFVDGSDSGKGKAVIATISRANAVTWGSVVTFSNGNTRSLTCCKDDGDVIVAWTDNNADPNMVILSINEMVITSVGTTLVLSKGGAGTILKVGASVVYACSGRALVLERNGTELRANTAYAYNNNAASSFVSAAAISTTQFIV